MALTEGGRALTEVHRQAQIRLGAGTMLKAAALWSLLDLADLDGSTPAWLAATLGMARSEQAASADMAARYVTAFREAEIGEQPGPVVRPVPNDIEIATTARINGPVRVKTLIGNGVEAERAYRAGMVAVQGALMQVALQAGRELIDKTARLDPKSGRYRRVTDGQPCAFCAMLASRGPVYSEHTAYFRAHPRCGCTAEIVYGEWVPNEREAEWVRAYEQAAREAKLVDGVSIAPKPGDDEDTVLWRMRRNFPHLFHDGIFPS